MAREGIAALLLILPVASSFLAPRLHFTPRQAYCSSYHLSHSGSRTRHARQLHKLRAQELPDGGKEVFLQREFPAVPVPPSQVDRAIVPGQRRELHLYAPADVAAARKAIEDGGQLLHVVMDPDALANKEFALCRYSTVLRIANVKPSVHRTMMGTNVESLLLDVIGTRRAEVGGLVHEEPYVAVMAAEPNTAQDSSPQGRSVLDNVVDKAEMLFEQCRSVALDIPTLEPQVIPLPMDMPRSPFTYAIGKGEAEPKPDRALADMVDEAVALREGDGEVMTKEAVLELRACAMLQLLAAEDKMKLFTSASEPAQVATMAMVGLESTYKKLVAMKSLSGLSDGGNWPAI